MFIRPTVDCNLLNLRAGYATSGTSIKAENYSPSCVSSTGCISLNQVSVSAAACPRLVSSAKKTFQPDITVKRQHRFTHHIQLRFTCPLASLSALVSSTSTAILLSTPTQSSADPNLSADGEYPLAHQTLQALTFFEVLAERALPFRFISSGTSA